MKKNYRYLMTGLLLSTSMLSAEIDEDFLGSSTFSSQEALQKMDDKAFHITSSVDYVGAADHVHNDGKLKFNEEDIYASMVVWYNECYKEGFIGTVGYDHTDINWTENPYFDQHHFNTVNLAVTYFTERVCDWLWQIRLEGDFDVNHFDPAEYATYDFLLWGRYDYCDDLGIHLGFLGYTGMKIDRVYPLFGFDYKFNDTWKLNAVFPVNISLIYTYDCNWSADVSMRFWDDRHRVGNDEPLRKAIVCYRAWGIEAGLNYMMDNTFDFNVHAGYNLGVNLKIANRQNKHSHREHFDGAPYVGGEVGLRF